MNVEKIYIYKGMHLWLCKTKIVFVSVFRSCLVSKSIHASDTYLGYVVLSK